ncbi:SMI1/KNR4 family protein [Paenibacillus vortex]|uniref:SMI1/KNR4 family protein n=1 Tax=Paenibacillus vortex TaxID=71995 RepID=UPI000A02D423|nr:SMI1/KNR4 family protein [Paenibacillus vortex]
MNGQSLIKSLVKEKEIHETYEVASKEDIEKTENDLNCKLPKSYCDFVSQFSNGAFIHDSRSKCSRRWKQTNLSDAEPFFTKND